MTGSKLNTAVGARIRDIRKGKKLTLKGVAAMTGTSTQTVSRLETGVMTISVEWLEKFSVALDVPVTAFFEAQPGLSVQKMIAEAVDRRTADWLREKLAEVEATQ